MSPLLVDLIEKVAPKEGQVRTALKVLSVKGMKVVGASFRRGGRRSSGLCRLTVQDTVAQEQIAERNFLFDVHWCIGNLASSC